MPAPVDRDDFDPIAEQREEDAVHALSDLDDVVDQERKLATRLAEIIARRDELIVDASNLGVSRATVARRTGLTRGRIQQIVTAHRARTDQKEA